MKWKFEQGNMSKCVLFRLESCCTGSEVTEACLPNILRKASQGRFNVANDFTEAKSIHE